MPAVAPGRAVHDARADHGRRGVAIADVAITGVAITGVAITGVTSTDITVGNAAITGVMMAKELAEIRERAVHFPVATGLHSRYPSVKSTFR